MIYIVGREEFNKFMEIAKNLKHTEIIDEIIKHDEWSIEQKLNIATSIGEMEWRLRKERDYLYKNQ